MCALSAKNAIVPSCDSLRFSAGVIEVKAMKEDTFIPDRVKGCIKIKCVRSSVAKVQASMKKRLEYVLHVFRRNKINEHEDVIVNQRLMTLGDDFCLTAEINFTMSRLDRYQEVTNLLIEKLKNMIVIFSPEFFHSNEELDRCRLRVCLQAIEIAKAKAVHAATLLNQKLGKPISVTEEAFNEWKKHTSMQLEDPLELTPDLRSVSLQSRIDSATVVMRSQVAVKFTLLS